jgi:apolipoprotein N-acyltransferase
MWVRGQIMEIVNKNSVGIKDIFQPFVWFILGFGSFMFTRSTFFVPIAIILAPTLILHFTRSLGPKTGIFLTLLGFCLSVTIALWGLFDIGDDKPSLVFNTIRSFLLAVLLALPYLADRMMYYRFKGFVGTLVFPVSATALYFLNSLEGPFDGDGVFSLYFIGDLSFKQLVSVTGLWGLVFVLSWTASVLHWIWENKFQWDTIRNGVAVFVSSIVIILGFGGVKLSPLMVSDDVKTIRIAAVTINSPSRESLNFEKTLESKVSSPFDETILKIKDLTKQAAFGGAKIVTFQEYALLIEEMNQTKMVEALCENARENAVHLSLSYGLFASKGKGENRHIFINDEGEVAANYMKRYLLGLEPIGGEAVHMKKGPTIIPVVNTPYGNIGLSICRDMSFPPYIRQAGRNHVDIMLSPAFDFPRGRSHAYLMRAIENGFSFVRPTCNGISFAVDYNGEILASKDCFANSHEIMYADVPIKGKKTVYPIIGDLFAWLCIIGFAAFIIVAILA